MGARWWAGPAAPIQGVAGNYDSTVATDDKHCGGKYDDLRQEELSHLSCDWTRHHITISTKPFLGALPFRLDIRSVGGTHPNLTPIFVHGTRAQPAIGPKTESP
ncbi:MAG: hypothetical protein ABI679_08790 [Gemmatimonadota bacterium]